MLSVPAVRRVLIALALATLAAFLGPAALVRAQSAAAPATNVTLMEWSEVYVAFAPPAGWTQKSSGLAPGTVAAFVGPVSDQFAANFNLRTTAYGAGELPDDLPQQLLPLLRRDLPTYRIVSSERTKVSGVSGFRVDGAFTAASDDLVLRNRQVFAVHNNRLYIFTFTAADTGFATTAPAFDKMIRSVLWKAPRAVQGAGRPTP